MDLPMRGMYSEVGGMFSATSSMKTEKASSTVSPSVTFSPLSGGNRKPVTDSNRLTDSVV